MKKIIMNIKSELITDAVTNLCKQANIHIPVDVYKAIFDSYLREKSSKSKNILSQILENLKLANISDRPICQDTGIVVVFVEIGQNIVIDGDLLESAINKGIEKAYKDFFFRKSIVQDPIFNRINTKTNTPAVVHTKIVEGNSIRIHLAPKGCGSENMSSVKMLKPSVGIEGIIDFVIETVKNAGANPCPPIRLGIGVGGTMEYAALLSKKALLEPIKSKEELIKLAENDELAKLQLEILNKVNNLGIGPAGLGGYHTCFGVNILTHPTHIAALPVAVNINCHASRHASAEIIGDEIIYHSDKFQYEFPDIVENFESGKRVNTSDIETLRTLKAGECVLLNGEILAARDAAHKKLSECIKNGKALPIEIQDKIIYYTGPCPPTGAEIIGPAGPTTSGRMDKYTPDLMDLGLFGSIGKGQRSDQVLNSIIKNKGAYFIATGGAACFLANRIVESQVIAYPELGPEAIYRLILKDFPVIVAIDKNGNNIYNHYSSIQ